jgi:hypothetical protein
MIRLMKTIHVLTTLILITGLSMSARAAFVLLDNMDYGASNVGTGVGDWVDGSNRLQYVGGTNVNYTGGSYANDPGNTAGTSGSLERNDNIDDRFFTRDYSDAGLTGEVWMSSLIRFDGGAGDLAGEVAGISLNSTGGLNLAGDLLGVGFDGTNYRPVWYDDSTTTSNYASSTISAGSTLLLVTKFNIVGAGDDSFSMWLFGSGDSPGLTEASLGTAHLSSSTADFGSSLDHIQVGGVQGMLSYYDQIRISDLSGDSGLQEVMTGTAIPEPSSLMLILVGLTGLVALRHRK